MEIDKKELIEAINQKEREEKHSEAQMRNEMDKKMYRRHIILGEEYTPSPTPDNPYHLTMIEDEGVFFFLTGRKMLESEYFDFCEKSEYAKEKGIVWGIKDWLIENEIELQDNGKS